MGLHTLPHEIRQKIADFLDTKSLVKFIHSGQSDLDNNFVWKQKCLQEYNYCSGRVRNWKEKYKKLYLRKCIHCHKNTKLYNEFYNVKVCKKCELDHSKYHTVSYSKAKKTYLLNDKELSTLHSIYTVNPYNSTQKQKLYLKNDIMKCIVNPQGNYIQTIQYRMDIRRMYHINRVTKFNIILSTLAGVYNVSASNLIGVLSNLNMYSKGLYEKFMRYDNRPPLPIINKALELDFIFTYTRILLYDAYNSFEELLLSHLLTNIITLLPININGHIDQCIRECVEKNRECFLRRRLVINIFNELKSRITIANVLKIHAVASYIRTGKIITLSAGNTRAHIKTHILIHDFLYTNTDIQAIMFEYNLLGKFMDKYSAYLQVLNNWYSVNPELRYKLPKELYPLLCS